MVFNVVTMPVAWTIVVAVVIGQGNGLDFFGQEAVVLLDDKLNLDELADREWPVLLTELGSGGSGIKVRLPMTHSPIRPSGKLTNLAYNSPCPVAVVPFAAIVAATAPLAGEIACGPEFTHIGRVAGHFADNAAVHCDRAIRLPNFSLFGYRVRLTADGPCADRVGGNYLYDPPELAAVTGTTPGPPCPGPSSACATAVIPMRGRKMPATSATSTNRHQ